MTIILIVVITFFWIEYFLLKNGRKTKVVQLRTNEPYEYQITIKTKENNIRFTCYSKTRYSGVLQLLKRCDWIQLDKKWFSYRTETVITQIPRADVKEILMEGKRLLR